MIYVFAEYYYVTDAKLGDNSSVSTDVDVVVRLAPHGVYILSNINPPPKNKKH